MSAALALRRAVQARLNADPDLSALLGTRIYDRVPDRAAYPYVVQGAVETLPLDGEGAVQHLLTLEVWSRAPGRREALLILHALTRALDGAAPALDGHRLVSLRAISSAALPDEGGGLYCAAAIFRAVTEPK